jgi:hypothetical protein
VLNSGDTKHLALSAASSQPNSARHIARTSGVADKTTTSWFRPFTISKYLPPKSLNLISQLKPAFSGILIITRFAASNPRLCNSSDRSLALIPRSSGRIIAHQLGDTRISSPWPPINLLKTIRAASFQPGKTPARKHLSIIGISFLRLPSLGDQAIIISRRHLKNFTLYVKSAN